MRTLRFLLQKEFKQIFRNPMLIGVIFIMPLVQLLILPWAANFDIKNITIAIVDQDRSDYSTQLVKEIGSSGYFLIIENTNSYSKALRLLEKDKADILLQIPSGFEQGLIRENMQQLWMSANAINGVKAIVGIGYLGSIINRYNSNIKSQWIQDIGYSEIPNIDISSSNWFNPAMNYQVFMVPGILVMLVSVVGGMMSAINIVKEKELGTIEQINVTPIKKHLFMLGKLIPFWIIGIIVFSLGLLIARFVYGIIPLGSIPLIYAFLAVYLVALLGFGLLLSNYANTQQQGMSLIFFFLMIFILLSGLFTPIRSMPEWAQIISYITPLTYFIDVMRLVILKGSGFVDIRHHFLVITIMAVVVNFFAVISYRKIHK